MAADHYPDPSPTERANILAVHRACALTAENADLRRLVLALADRVELQSRLLTRAAERRPAT